MLSIMRLCAECAEGNNHRHYNDNHDNGAGHNNHFNDYAITGTATSSTTTRQNTLPNLGTLTRASPVGIPEPDLVPGCRSLQ